MSDQSMVVRIAESQVQFDGRGALTYMPKADRERYLERARLFLRDLREPTQAMLRASTYEFNGDVWREMIDAALKED